MLVRFFRYLGKSVLKAVENINAIIAPALKVICSGMHVVHDESCTGTGFMISDSDL